MVWKIIAASPTMSLGSEPYHWTRSTALIVRRGAGWARSWTMVPAVASHQLALAHSNRLLTLDCISRIIRCMANQVNGRLILALLELDTTNSLTILFICKPNFRTRSFADLLL